MEFKFSIFVLVTVLCLNCYVSKNLVNCQTTGFVNAEEVSVAVAVTEHPEIHLENEVEDSLENWIAPEKMRKELVYYHSGFDDDNRPIWIAEFGKWDVKKYLEGGTESANLYDKYADQMIHRILQSVDKKSTAENPVTEFVMIADAEGYSLEQLTSAAALLYNLRKLSSSLALIEAMGKGIVLNTSFLVQRAVNLARPILGGNINKIEFFGTNKSKWLPKLLKQIPRSQIPQWYGGTKDYKPIKVYG